MRDFVHRGTAVVEGPRSRAGHGRSRLQLAGLAPPGASRRLKRQPEGAALPIALMAFDGAPAPSKHLARSVALVGKQAPATGTGATINRDAGIGCRGGLLGQPLPPQLLHAATDCLEIVSCSGP